MPKLSTDSLNKRFPCQYCGDSFRTRQGLSGHIQWKHQKKDSKLPDITLTPEIAINLKMLKEGLDLSKSELAAMIDVTSWWSVVKLFCEAFDIELNQQDLKNYLITSLAQIRQSERLKQQLVDILTSLTNK